MTTTALVTEAQLGVIENALDAICADQRAVRTPKQRLDLVAVGRRVAQRLEALSTLLVAEADAEDASMVAKGTPLTSWLQMIGRLDRRVASGIVFAGKRLAANPRVGEATLAGKASVRQGRAITDALASLPQECNDRQRDDGAELLLKQAQTDPPEVLRKAVPEVIAQVAPELMPADPVGEADARRKRARGRRSLRFSPDGDGGVGFTGSLPDLEAARFKKLIAAYHEADKRRARDVRDPLAEERTRGQRDADALIALLDHHVRQGNGPRVAGDRPRVVVTMSYDRLRDQAKQAGVLESGAEISAGDLRRLCCEADLLPAVLGGDSEIMDWGMTERLVTPEQRQALSFRDGGCVFPGCGAEDPECQAHHLRGFWNLSPTNLNELALVCPHHHQLVEPPRLHPSAGPPPDRWRLRMGGDGVPEVIPPRRVDSQQRPLRHARFRRRATDQEWRNGNARNVG